jgi:hypothetical protein
MVRCRARQVHPEHRVEPASPEGCAKSIGLAGWAAHVELRLARASVRSTGLYERLLKLARTCEHGERGARGLDRAPAAVGCHACGRVTPSSARPTVGVTRDGPSADARGAGAGAPRAPDRGRAQRATRASGRKVGRIRGIEAADDGKEASAPRPGSDARREGAAERRSVYLFTGARCSAVPGPGSGPLPAADGFGAMTRPRASACRTRCVERCARGEADRCRVAPR